MRRRPPNGGGTLRPRCSREATSSRPVGARHDRDGPRLCLREPRLDLPRRVPPRPRGDASLHPDPHPPFTVNLVGIGGLVATTSNPSPVRNAKAATRLQGKAQRATKPRDRPAVIDTDGGALRSGDRGAKEGGPPRQGRAAPASAIPRDVVEADHGKPKRPIRPTPGFRSLRTAYAIGEGCDMMRALRKGQGAFLRCLPGAAGEVSLMHRDLGPARWAANLAQLPLRHQSGTAPAPFRVPDDELSTTTTPTSSDCPCTRRCGTPDISTSLPDQGWRTILGAATRPARMSAKARAPSASGRASVQSRVPRRPSAMAPTVSRKSAAV